ncbi:MAG: M50 family metallopeptidase [Clostridiales bacterium]|nr:M50 family metallopeptidase [Clostridiales bacterium]
MKLKLRSAEVTISYLFICLTALCIILGAFQNYLYCLLAVILHETGHLILICLLGGPPDKIKISLFEITVSDSRRQQRSVFQNFLIIFFGPFANFICFIFLYLLYLIFSSEIFLSLAFANISVCLFNLLPVLSLDGGQMLYLLLSRRFSDAASEKAVNIITFIFIFPLAALGFLLLFNSRYNFSLLLICIYLILSLIMKNNRYY